MKIIKIQKIKDGRYNLLFSNQKKITTYDEVILKNNLLTEKEIDESLLQVIEKESAYYQNYRKILNYCKLRLRSQKELKNYMEKLNFSSKEQGKIIQDLKKFGFYNDNNFVKAYVSDKMYLTNWGPNKIKLELLKYDIKEEIIDIALNEISNEEIEEKLRKQLVKKCSSNHNNSLIYLKKKLVFEFTNLGYNEELILSILEGFTLNEDKTILHEFMKFKRSLEKKYTGENLYIQIKQRLYHKGFSIDSINQVIEENRE